MRLYKVLIATDVVVWASDYNQAMRFALESHQDERRHAAVIDCQPVLDPQDLPGGWDSGSLPYGRTDDVTVGEIMGAKA